MTHAGRSAAQLAMAWALSSLPICAWSQTPYVQTQGSIAAFQFFENIRNSEQGDVLNAARKANLINEGVCQETGVERLYCHALRVTEVIFSGHLLRPQFSMRYEELRACIAPDHAVGFIAYGTDGAIPLPLYREYPEEFASLMQSPQVEVNNDPRSGERTFLVIKEPLTDLQLSDTVRQLGYGIPESAFEHIKHTNGDEYVASYYPDHAVAELACSQL